MHRITYVIVPIVVIVAGCSPQDPRVVAPQPAGQAQPGNQWIANAPKIAKGPPKVVAIAPPDGPTDGAATTHVEFDKKVQIPVFPEPGGHVPTAARELDRKETVVIQAAGNK